MEEVGLQQMYTVVDDRYVKMQNLKTPLAYVGPWMRATPGQVSELRQEAADKSLYITNTCIRAKPKLEDRASQ